MFTTSNAFLELSVAYGLNVIAYASALALIIATLLLFKRGSTLGVNNLTNGAAHPQVRFATIVALLSLSGVPPLFGFFAKFFLILLIASKGSWLLLVGFGVFNLFALYFYFQQLRYLAQSPHRKEYQTFMGHVNVIAPMSLLWSIALCLLLFGGTLIEGLVLLFSMFGA